MHQSFDTGMLAERARGIAYEIRRSDAYPAIVGGIAGGIAGALIAAMIASRYAPRADTPAAADPRSSPRNSPGGIDMRSAVELLAVVAGLVKQVREWYEQSRKR